MLYFALGVELAQIVVVAIILLAGFIAQDFLKIKRRDWVLVLSSIVIGIIYQCCLNANFGKNLTALKLFLPVLCES